MTPDEVDALTDDEYDAFVRFMVAEAKAIAREARKRR